MKELKRIFVGYGQGGIFTSPAISGLADKLKAYGVVSLHNWQDFLVSVVAHVKVHGGMGTVAIGYSLSASALQDISTRCAPHRIKLGVSIDASKQYYLANRDAKGEWTQHASQFDKVLCFYNPGAWIFGGVKYVGDNVTVVPVNAPHLTVQGLPIVWSKTEEAVKNA